MGFKLPSGYPVFPGGDPPDPIPVPFRWTVTLDINGQLHSSVYTRGPGYYDGMDVEVGQWMANITTGQTYQIISISAKTTSSITCTVQDMYRYNTFRAQAQDGNGEPSAGGQEYVIFEVGEDGSPFIDPKPDNLVSSSFWINLLSRFNYINTQYDYSLFQKNNTFNVGDAIAVDATTNSFVKASGEDKITIGRATSISDTMPSWFTINPVSKIDEFLDYLPGNIGSIIYTDAAVPGALTTVSGGDPVYVKLRNNGQSQTKSVSNAIVSPGTSLQVNGQTIEFTAPGNMTSIASDFNTVSALSGVVATVGLVDNVVNYDPALQGPFPYLITTGNAAQATINGVTVTFDVPQTWGTVFERTTAGSDAMASAINAAGIPGIVATSVLNGGLTLTNITGGAINIVNVRSDAGGTPFAGSNSASGLPLSNAASVNQCVVLTAVDARPINLLNVIANPTGQLGLVSVENAPKASGLFIGAGLREATNTVVVNLAARNALTPLIGDQAFVINSDDGSGNYVNQWSNWLWDGSTWVLMSRQSTSTVAAKTLEYSLTTSTPASFNIGNIVSGTRVTVVTVEVMTAFTTSSLLELGYSVANPTSPEVNTSGLMSSTLIDLSRTGVYATTGDTLFGTDTATGDVTLTGTFISGGSPTGSARILVSYV